MKINKTKPLQEDIRGKVSLKPFFYNFFFIDFIKNVKKLMDDTIFGNYFRINFSSVKNIDSGPIAQKGNFNKTKQYTQQIILFIIQ